MHPVTVWGVGSARGCAKLRSPGRSAHLATPTRFPVSTVTSGAERTTQSRGSKQ